MAKDVIIACDFPSKRDTLEFLDSFATLTRKPFVKIGMELFYAEGPDIVRELKARGHRIFLDLKLHDIPHTVEKAMRVLARLGVDMTNVHAAGGLEMMRAARRGLDAGAAERSGAETPAPGDDGTGNAVTENVGTGGSSVLQAGAGSSPSGRQRPVLLAVTQLTSTSRKTMNHEIGIPGEVADTVTAYAKNAKAAGLDGVVCSPLEAGMIHTSCGDRFLTVTPGIRFAGAAADDQSRVTTPAKAREIGSDYIVVGRPITQADDPAAAYARCMREFLGSAAR